jgi:hypothetical protein
MMLIGGTTPDTGTWIPITTVVLAAFLAAIGFLVRSLLANIKNIATDVRSTNDKLDGLGTRLAVVETKQDINDDRTAKTARVTAKTARKVGLRLAPELEQTIGGSPL